jgi:4-amino-4-deoxy-L-arabinose transferase-like glycosyltransferase
LQRFILAKRAWLVLLLAVVAVYFYGLGSAPLLGPDEPRYAQVAREMYARGDWVTPTLGGHTWFEKPALLYWMMMAGYRLFGVSEFAARFGSACAGLLTLLLIAWVGRRVELAAGERMRPFGITCAVVAASSAGLVVFSRGASFDIVLTATVTASLSCFFVSEIERDERRRRLLLAGFYAGIGASLLAKGLIGIVIPAGVVGLYFILRRRLPNPFRLGIISGTLICLMVAASWYAPVIARHGHAFVDEFFIQHHFARYVSNKYHHPQPFYFYVPIMALLALPWTAFLAGGLASVRELSWHAEEAPSKLRVLAFAWLVVPVLFFSLSGSKLPGYVLPALPGAALLAAERVQRFLRGGEGALAMRLTGALALLLFCAGLAYAVYDLKTGGGAAASSVLPGFACSLAILVPAGVAGVVAVFCTRRRELCVFTIAGATLLTVALVSGCALEKFARAESVGPLLAEASARGLGDLKVFQLHTVERTAEFYAEGRIKYDDQGEAVKLEGGRQAVEAVRAAGGRALVFVPAQYIHQLTDEPGVEASVIGDNGHAALVLIEVRD